MSARPRRGALGFTLIELLTTLIIIGVLGFIALPRFYDTQAFEERGYVDEVASALRYARKIAVATQCEVSVVLAADSYVAWQRDTQANCNSGGASWTMPVRRGDGSALTGNAPPDVTMAPAAAVIFQSDGRPTVAPPSLTAGNFTITIDGTGRVTVQP